MIRLLFLCVAVLSFFSVTSYAEKKNLLDSQVSAQLVTLNKEGKESLSEVQEVKSGDVIEYTLKYQNISKGALQNLEVVGPIPVGTVYIKGSASKNITKKIKVSLGEGKNWNAIPVYKRVKAENGKEKKVEVPVEEYRQLKWIVGNPLKAGERFDFTFRVKVQ